MTKIIRDRKRKVWLRTYGKAIVEGVMLTLSFIVFYFLIILI